MEVTSFNTNLNKMINFISIKFIFSLITRCKKFIVSLNWSSYPLCHPWFWKTLLSVYLAHACLLLIFYYIYLLPFVNIDCQSIWLRSCVKESVLKFVKSCIFLLEGLILSLADLNTEIKLQEIVTYTRNCVATHWYTISIIYNYIINYRRHVVANSGRLVNGRNEVTALKR